jgi:hypothetical protein
MKKRGMRKPWRYQKSRSKPVHQPHEPRHGLVQIGHRGVEKNAEEHRRRAQGVQGVDSGSWSGIGHCYSA